MIRMGYIASNSFSGSTLLTLLLGAHPRISTVGELKWGNLDLDSYRCSCGKLLRECGYWQHVQGEMDRQGLSFELQNPRTEYRVPGSLALRVSSAAPRGMLFETARDMLLALLPAARREWDRFRRVNAGAIQAMLEADHAECFVDASKDPLRLRYLLDTGDYDLRIIHLVRDGRAVTCSGIKNEGAEAGHVSREWVRTHDQIKRLARRVPKQSYVMMRYEDLCRDPAGMLNMLCDFLSLPQADLLAQYAQSEQHVLGNRMRLEARNGIKLDEKWRTMLQPGQLATFERIGGGLNRQYGYE
jgi:Sulfotransferase family